MIETYKDVVGFENIYQISNLGNIKSFKQCKTGKVLKVTNKKGDYLRVRLVSNTKTESTYIHRLVAIHFIDNPNNLKCVNHKDLNKQNNNIKNLEWCTAKDNVLHSVKNNPSQIKGMIYFNKYIKPKKILQYTKANEFVGSFQNAVEAEKVTGICSRNILQVANKTAFNKKGSFRKTAGGFKWKFESEVMP